MENLPACPDIDFLPCGKRGSAPIASEPGQQPSAFHRSSAVRDLLMTSYLEVAAMQKILHDTAHPYELARVIAHLNFNGENSEQKGSSASTRNLETTAGKTN